MKKEIIIKAVKHLNEICQNPKKFNMSIPARRDDSDIIFSTAFNYAQALEIENFQLKKRIKDLEFLEKATDRKIDSLKTEIHDQVWPTSSGQYVVFNRKNDKFCDPIIVDAHGVVEALCPEDDSYEREFATCIRHIDEFKQF